MKNPYPSDTAKWALVTGRLLAGFPVSMPDLTKVYPRAARKAAAEGSTTLAIGLSDKGEVNACRVTAPSGSTSILTQH